MCDRRCMMGAEFCTLSQRCGVLVLGRARHCAARATSRQPGAAHAVMVAVGTPTAERRSVGIARATSHLETAEPVRKRRK